MKRFVVPLILLCFVCGCTKDKGVVDYSGYPARIGSIIQARCATSGCHGEPAGDENGFLNLSSWDNLYKGGKNNSVLIPFRSDLSKLFSYANHFHELGPSQHHQTNSSQISKNEVLMVRDWITEGGLNRHGEMKFPDNSSDPRMYIANQGCDLIEVFDTKSRLLIRAFEIGNEPKTESPHDLMMSPDGQYLYISYYLSNVIHKFRTADNKKTGELTLPDIGWHSMAISGDGKSAIATHLDGSGKMILLDMEDFSVKLTFILTNAHGCALNYDGTVAYVSNQQGNHLYKVNLQDIENPIVQEITLEPGEPPKTFGDHKPYSISFFPDYSKYAVTCQGISEIRIYNASNDSMVKAIKTIGIPQLMSFSKTRPYLFVTCMSDNISSSSESGVNVINYTNLNLLTSINTGEQPRGLSVDDAGDCVWIANRNISAIGWQPHHTNACNGPKGYMTLIDMKSLTIVEDWKCETSVDPYSVIIRK